MNVFKCEWGFVRATINHVGEDRKRGPSIQRCFSNVKTYMLFIWVMLILETTVFGATALESIGRAWPCSVSERIVIVQWLQMCG